MIAEASWKSEQQDTIKNIQAFWKSGVMNIQRFSKFV